MVWLTFYSHLVVVSSRIRFQYRVSSLFFMYWISMAFIPIDWKAHLRKTANVGLFQAHNNQSLIMQRLTNMILCFCFVCEYYVMPNAIVLVCRRDEYVCAFDWQLRQIIWITLRMKQFRSQEIWEIKSLNKETNLGIRILACFFVDIKRNTEYFDTRHVDEIDKKMT